MRPRPRRAAASLPRARLCTTTSFTTSCACPGMGTPFRRTSHLRRRAGGQEWGGRGSGEDVRGAAGLRAAGRAARQAREEKERWRWGVAAVAGRGSLA